jgi:arabinoxylan arabinofuranohydrolase
MKFYFDHLKLLSTLLLLSAIISNTAAQNPLTPAGIYFADPSAHVWNNRLYLYGSLDENCDYWCSWKHHVLETIDMKTWNIHENIFESKGEKDQVPYNDQLLFAPDCAFRNDTFFLYYCQPDEVSAEGVATSNNPEGPFQNGKKLNVGDFQQIDPSLFIDDDGQAYYLWGQFSLKMAKMNPDMRTLDLSTIKENVITEKEHFFHEGAFLAKRNGIYYLVYTDISRAEMPTCIGYATAVSPLGPYKYRGVIIDNDHCNPQNWNNHGSIAEFNENWYVFYHRSTHGCDRMRKPCVEPITFLPDGSIPEVEMTSQGAGSPLSARSRIEAEYACLLFGNVMIRSFSDSQEELARMKNGDRVAFKYLDFGSGVHRINLRVAPGINGGKIIITADKPWNWKNMIAEINIDANSGYKKWETLSFEINNISGIHELYLQFNGDGEDLMAIDWFEFD